MPQVGTALILGAAFRGGVALAAPLSCLSLAYAAAPVSRLGAQVLTDSGARIPAQRPQFPNLFSSYPVRPNWSVAGIDYPAGLPSGLALKDPTGINIAGVSINAGQHLINVTGDHVVLDSYDFSLEGGWGLYVQGANDVITRCNFKVGPNNVVPVNASSASSYLTISQTSFDGGGLGVVGNPGAIWALVSFNGNTLTIEHSWLHYAPEDAIDFNGGGTLVVRHNLFNNLGYASGAHPDSVQFVGGTVTNSIIDYNTVYFPQPQNGYPIFGGEGLQVEAQLGGVIRNTRLRNNVIISTGPQMVSGYLIAIRQDSGSILDGIDVQHNYLDSTGGWGPFYPPSGSNLSFINNIDLTTGDVLPPPKGARLNNTAPVSAAGKGRSPLPLHIVPVHH